MFKPSTCEMVGRKKSPEKKRLNLNVGDTNDRKIKNKTKLLMAGILDFGYAR